MAVPRPGNFAPEPFFGVQNSLNSGKGLVRLAPGKAWKWKLELSTGFTTSKKG